MANDAVPSRRMSLSFRSSNGVITVCFARNARIGTNSLLTGVGSGPLRTRLGGLRTRIPLTGSHICHRRALLRGSTIDRRTCRRITARCRGLVTSVRLMGTGVTRARLQTPFSKVVNLHGIDRKTCTSPSAIVAGLAGVSPLGVRFSIPRHCSTSVGSNAPVMFEVGASINVVRSCGTAICTMRDGVSRTAHSLGIHTACPGQSRSVIPKHCASIRVAHHSVGSTLTVPDRTLVPRVKGGVICLCGGNITRPTRVVLKLHARDRIRMLGKLDMNSAIVASNIVRLQAKVGISVSGLGWQDGVTGVSRVDVGEPMLSAIVAVVLLLFKVVNCGFLKIHRFPDISGPVVSIGMACPKTGTRMVVGRVARPLRRGVGNVPNVHSLDDIDDRKDYHVAMRFRLSISLRATTGSIHSGISHTRHCLPHSYSPPAMSGTSTSTAPVVRVNVQDDGHSLVRLDRVTRLAIGRQLRAVPGIDNISV